VPSAQARTPEKRQQREAALGLVSALWTLILDGKAGSLWEAIEISESRDALYGSMKAALQALLDHSGDRNGTEQFLGAMAHHLVPWKRVPDFLSEVGSWVRALDESSQSSTGSSVRLMTFQAAKGLEAKVVCVMGLEEGVIPRGSDSDDIAEQSRLLFVSMTRAVSELHLFHARKRASNVMLRNVFKGESGRPDIAPSRFLDAICSEHIERTYHRA
jgi:superfamily I DNA/RNA helicase